MEGDGRDLKHGETVPFRKESSDHLVRVALLISVEQLQQAPVILGPLGLGEVEDEGDLPALQEDTITILVDILDVDDHLELVVVTQQRVSVAVLGAKQIKCAFVKLQVKALHYPGTHLFQ